MRGLQEADKFGRDKEPGRLDIEQLPYVQACFKARLPYHSRLFQRISAILFPVLQSVVTWY